LDPCELLEKIGGISYNVYVACVPECCASLRAHHITRHNTPIRNILSTAPQLSPPQKALGTLPEDGNVMPKHVGDKGKVVPLQASTGLEGGYRYGSTLS
jgi:hypothetical protein